jgi:hypothetical protein
VSGVEPVQPTSRGEQQQCLAEDVELELGVDVVADDVVAPGVAGQVQPALVGDSRPGRGVRRAKTGSVVEYPGTDELRGRVQQGVRPGGRDGLACVAEEQARARPPPGWKEPS